MKSSEKDNFSNTKLKKKTQNWAGMKFHSNEIQTLTKMYLIVAQATSDKQLLFLNCNSAILQEARPAVRNIPSRTSSFKCTIRIHTFKWYTNWNITLIGLISTFHFADRSSWPKWGFTDVNFLNNLVLYVKNT